MTNKQSTLSKSLVSSLHPYGFFPSLRAATLAGLAFVALAAMPTPVRAQAPGTTVPAPTTTQTSPDGTSTTTVAPSTGADGQPTTSVTATKTFNRGRKKSDAEKAEKPVKTVATKDTKRAIKKDVKSSALIDADSKLPDKQLYDKALVATKKGHYDVARLDLQTMLNTYPDSKYQMRAKLAVADSWYKEGGTAALTQAESEYADFRVFFPNTPEAAEAQMRIGDIYFRQMDKPDRDYQKSLHAEEEYRRMLTDYPDSTLVPQAKQRLREVQEVLASRESDIASYYSTRNNFAAQIARYQTVVDTYPLYSHLDDVLIGLGDAYEAQARYVRGLVNLPEGGKAQLERLYDTEAADCYRKVVTEHAASLHVEDARDRLAAMGKPIPEPTPEQVAASAALENSRGTYTISKRATTLFLHAPDTVLSATRGEPTMIDPKTTVAPTIVKKIQADFSAAFPGTAPVLGVPAPEVKPATAIAETPDAAQPATAPARPLAFGEIGGQDDAPTGTTNLTAPASVPKGASGSGIGVEVLTPGARVGSYDPGLSPAATGAPDPNNGLKAVGPDNTNALPPVERAGAAPDRPNEVTAPTPVGQTPSADGKKGKPSFDKSDESSSKHKKKKGLKKIVEPL